MQPGFKNTTTPSPIITTVTTTTLLSTQERRGCPLNYDWCLYTPIIKLFQFLLGFAFFVSGYSIVNVMSFAIYSKLLGPKPQGTMMGILTSFGSLARAIGPIAVSYLYGDYGPRVSLITLGSIVVSCILIIITTYKKYEPYKFS
jgi:ceroid-lipofuscinosis MFS transporter 7